MVYRELTSKEKRAIKELVIKNCANYCGHYRECLPLDNTCYMLNMHYFRENLCKYFESAMLPLNHSLEVSLYNDQLNTKPCVICGDAFIPTGNQATCSENCSETSKKKATKERVRKHRQNKR